MDLTSSFELPLLLEIPSQVKDAPAVLTIDDQVCVKDTVSLHMFQFGERLINYEELTNECFIAKMAN